jgi:hypothetical protein
MVEQATTQIRLQLRGPRNPAKSMGSDTTKQRSNWLYEGACRPKGWPSQQGGMRNGGVIQRRGTP